MLFGTTQFLSDFEKANPGLKHAIKAKTSLLGQRFATDPTRAMASYDRPSYLTRIHRGLLEVDITARHRAVAVVEHDDLTVLRAGDHDMIALHRYTPRMLEADLAAPRLDLTEIFDSWFHRQPAAKPDPLQEAFSDRWLYFLSDQQ